MYCGYDVIASSTQATPIHFVCLLGENPNVVGKKGGGRRGVTESRPHEAYHYLNTTVKSHALAIIRINQISSVAMTAVTGDNHLVQVNWCE